MRDCGWSLPILCCCALLVSPGILSLHLPRNGDTWPRNSPATIRNGLPWMYFHVFPTVNHQHWACGEPALPHQGYFTSNATKTPTTGPLCCKHACRVTCFMLHIYAHSSENGHTIHHLRCEFVEFQPSKNNKRICLQMYPLLAQVSSIFRCSSSLALSFATNSSKRWVSEVNSSSCTVSSAWRERVE